MTSATNWTPGIVVLLGALAVGVGVLLKSRRGPALPAPVLARRDELDRQRDALYALIREHAGLRGEPPSAEWLAERDRLEVEAARALRALAQVGDAAPPPAPSGPGFGERNPRLVGALWGAGTVLFAVAIALGVQEFARPRAEGGSITGGGGMGGASASAGAASPDGAPPLTAEQTAQIARLRAEVEANPTDPDAHNRLGHALLHAGQLMDSFNAAEDTVKLRADDPEARTHQAIVLIAIGDTATAARALDKVIAGAPAFAEALAYRGALHFQAGEADAAIASFERAVAADPNLLGSVQPLIDAARAGNLPAAGAASASPPAGEPPAGMAAASPVASEAAAGPSPEDVTGTLTLDPSVAGKVRPGDTLFLSARPPGVDRGPPTWVLRAAVESFPMPFTLGPANAMLGGPTPGELVITARIDRDGNAMSKGPDDLEGRSAPLAPGARDISIAIGAPTP